MKCSVCKGECPEYGAVLLNPDGDFACCEECKLIYERDMHIFRETIIHSETLTDMWLRGEL